MLIAGRMIDALAPAADVALDGTAPEKRFGEVDVVLGIGVSLFHSSPI